MNSSNALYVVATPIGNLADMVPRAVEILKSVDVIAAEDKRHSQKLMQHFEIDTPLLAYHDHSDERVLQKLSVLMEQGQSIALISDAGTPLISDPGYRLVRHAHACGWQVIPIPGASALVAALSVSGLPTDRFLFEGFLPAKTHARSKRLESLSNEGCTLIFYEAPHRLLDSLVDMQQCFGGERRIVLARELTKAFETVINSSIDELLELVRRDPNQSRGEIVLLVEAGSEEAEFSPEIEKLLTLLSAELPPKKAAAIAAEFSGLAKKQLYQWLVDKQ